MRLLLFVLGAGLGAGLGPLPATWAETAPATALDGTNREFQAAFWQRVQQSPAHSVQPAGGDRDLHDIALLEDDGFLITPRSGTFVTDTREIIARFYASHADEFDILCILVSTDFPNNVRPENGFAFALPVANAVGGIGLPQFNAGSSLAPGVHRLKVVINMNDLGEFSEDPSDDLPQFFGNWSGMDILAQEFGHMFGAFINADNVQILGRGSTHWSFFFETAGSVLEGNGWQDNGNGTFTSVATATGYSPLDLYLFGFLDPNEVTHPMYVIEDAVPDLAEVGGESAIPAAGITVSGTRVPVSMHNILAIHGPRNPTAANSQKQYRIAWALIVPAASTPSSHDVEKTSDFRAQWEAVFAAQTRDLGLMTSDLASEPVEADFEARVFAGAPAMAIQFDNDSFGSTTGFHWDFGDGNTSDARHPTHTYARPGTYDVSLTVHGNGGPVTVTKPRLVLVGSVRTRFEDDFESERGWRVETESGVTTGAWIRIDPFGTSFQRQYGTHIVRTLFEPEDDHTAAGQTCYVTGFASAGSPPGNSDLDNGATSLISPEIDVSGASDPVLSFWHWFANNAGDNPGRDRLVVSVSNDGGASWVDVRVFHSSHLFWRQEQVRLAEFIAPTTRVRLRFRAADDARPSLVEVAIDDVCIFDVDTVVPVEVTDFAFEAHAEGLLLRWSLPDLAGITGVRVQRAAALEGPYAFLSGPALLPQNHMHWLDRDAASNQDSWYRIALDTPRGTVLSHSIAAALTRAAVGTKLLGTHEGEDGSVAIHYAIASATSVRFTIYDAAGRVVRELARDHAPAGSHTLEWDRLTQTSQRAPRGVYFIQLTAAHEVLRAKFPLLR